MLISERNFLFPVILAVSLFIGLSGMRTPECVRTAKCRLIPRNAVEIQVKETEAGGVKAGQAAEFCARSYSFAPVIFYISHYVHQTRCNPSTSAIFLPARAPPF